MRNGDTSRMILAITYTLVLCVLLVAGMQAVPSGRPFDHERLQSPPRFGGSNLPAETAVSEVSLP